MAEIENEIIHRSLTQEAVEALVEASDKVYIHRQMAFRAKVHPETFKSWLHRGYIDKLNNRDTLEADMYTRINYKLSGSVERLINNIKDLPRDYKAYAWVLERCFREDFGAESTLIKELINNLNELMSDANPINAQFVAKRITSSDAGY